MVLKCTMIYDVCFAEGMAGKPRSFQKESKPNCETIAGGLLKYDSGQVSP